MLGENPQSELRPPETRAGVLRSRVGDMRAETNGVKWCLVAGRTPCGVHPWNETRKPGTALARRRQGRTTRSRSRKTRSKASAKFWRNEARSKKFNVSKGSDPSE